MKKKEKSKEKNSKGYLVYATDKQGNLTDEFLLDEKPIASDAMKNFAYNKFKEIGIPDEKIQLFIKLMGTD